MPKLTETIKPRGLKLIQYGESGSGKSVRAAQFAQFGPIYFFDFDGKMDSLRMYLSAKQPTLLDKIDYDVYRGQDLDIIERVNAKLKAIEESIKVGKPLYATLVFDSWSAWERTYFDHLLARFNSMGGKGWGEARSTVQITKDEKVILPGTADHQLKNRAFPEFVDKITSLPLNVIVNCHLKEVLKGPATIAASGEIAKTLPKYFNEFHYLYSTALGQYKVRIKPNDEFLANSSRTDVGSSGVLDKDDLTVYDNFLCQITFW